MRPASPEQINEKMKTLLIILTIFIIGFSNSTSANLVSVASINDGSGLFTYKISAGADPYFFGGNTNFLKIVIPSKGVISTIDPPGWVSEINNDIVTWKCTNSALDYIDYTTIDFSLQSSMIFATNYSVSDMGFVQGEIYNTNHTLYSSGSTNELFSINTVGFEYFNISGPVVPEPIIFSLFVFLFLIRAYSKSFFCNHFA